MTTTPHNPDRMTDEQLDTLSGGPHIRYFNGVRHDPAEWTTRAIPRPYPVRHVPGVARTIGVPPEPK